MKTLSLDWRERILATDDAGEATRKMAAGRFRVSLGLVKQLLQQRRRLGESGAQPQRAGRKPRLRLAAGNPRRLGRHGPDR